jgi:alkylated DNA nucleotide flippase Atl1
VRTKKTWSEKLADGKDLPRVVNIDARMSKRWGHGTCAIPAPREVDVLMRRVPHGRITTINEIREALAKKHGATIGCPITTGIFAWIAANAADEAERAGTAKITPYWRTLKSGGEINPKYPGGLEAVRARLEAEGHCVVARGRRWFVADHERVLFRPKNR